MMFLKFFLFSFGNVASFEAFLLVMDAQLIERDLWLRSWRKAVGGYQIREERWTGWLIDVSLLEFGIV